NRISRQSLFAAQMHVAKIASTDHSSNLPDDGRASQCMSGSGRFVCAVPPHPDGRIPALSPTFGPFASFADVSALQIVFMGTPDLACASLEALLKSDGFHVAGVVTQPDRPKGRDLKTRASA